MSVIIYVNVKFSKHITPGGHLDIIYTIKLFYNKVKIIYCPPYTLLESFSKSIKKTKLELGAQNCHFHSEYGAFTGSVNSKMIKNVGCKYVILGHSENRIDGESPNLIKKK